MVVATDRIEDIRQGRTTYHGLRDWLEIIERMGQLKHVKGANWESEIGDATDVLQHAQESPAAIFEDVPGFDPGFRVLVNSFGSTEKIALTLGLPLSSNKVEVSNAWGRKIKGLRPIPPREVKDGPIFENVRRGKDVDLEIFPTPKWHPGDVGRYIGTGSYDITRDPDDGWVNLGTYRVQLQTKDKVGYYISRASTGGSTARSSSSAASGCRSPWSSAATRCCSWPPAPKYRSASASTTGSAACAASRWTSSRARSPACRCRPTPRS